MERTDLEMIKAVYRCWRESRRDAASAHPDEETFACFCSGLLDAKREDEIKAHLIACSRCAEILASQAEIEEKKPAAVSRDLLEKIQAFMPDYGYRPAEAEVSWREGVLRVVRLTHGLLLNRYTISPLMRSGRSLSSVKEVSLSRDFKKLRFELSISVSENGLFYLFLSVREKGFLRGGNELRAVLYRRGVETESRTLLKGRTTFNEIMPGEYALEITGPRCVPMAAIILLLNTER